MEKVFWYLEQDMLKLYLTWSLKNLYNFESIVYSNFTGKNGSYKDNCETHKKLTWMFLLISHNLRRLRWVSQLPIDGSIKRGSMSEKEFDFTKKKRVVVKIGSSSLNRGETGNMNFTKL